MADPARASDSPTDLARVARHLRLRLEVEGRAGLSAVAASAGAVPRSGAAPSSEPRASASGRGPAPSAGAAPSSEPRASASSGAAPSSEPRASASGRGPAPLPHGRGSDTAPVVGSVAARSASASEAAEAVADLKDDFARAREQASSDEADTYEDAAPAAGPTPAPAVHVKGPGLFDQLSPDLEDGSSPEEALQRIADEVAECTRCPELAANRTKTVPGQGSPYARLVFIGEGPGADEDQQGLAFVGRAGQLLTKMIEGIGMTRDEVFIMNVVKCRPPGNRNPMPEEEANCAPYLARQLEILRPKVIVALGGVATKCLLQTSDGITRLRGRFYPYKGARLMPTFHPAYILRNYTKDTRQKVYEDLLKAKEALGA